MTIFNKLIFITAHQLLDVNFYKIYNKLLNNQWRKYDLLKSDQEKQLKNIIKYSYDKVPYYHSLFKKLNVSPSEINTLNDLNKLPILTKDIINNNWNKFIPQNLSSIRFLEVSTGGTTGTPLRYRNTREEQVMGGAHLYRGWGYVGYNLADKMAMLGGASLDIGTESHFTTKIHEFTRNIRKLSSFDMSDLVFQKYKKIISEFKPKYIRGYPSSIFFFARWLRENGGLNYKINSVFTTSEKLFPHMRDTISEVFQCEVFDGYGLLDGGVSAFECKEHEGMHIDTERGLLQVMSKDGELIEEGEGKILATSLINYSMPFLFYDTGDNCELSVDYCSCGRQTKLIKNIIGRSVDVFFTPEGGFVHGWFFLYIFWQYDKGVVQYQVVQETLNDIIIYLVINDKFDEKQLQKIENLIKEKSINWSIKFKFVEKISKSKSGKYKFIINKLLEK